MLNAKDGNTAAGATLQISLSACVLLVARQCVDIAGGGFH